MTIFLSFMFMPVHSIFAALVGTEAVLGNGKIQSACEKVRIFMDGRDVQNFLTSQGIDPMEAIARVNSLSDAEVLAIADRIDQLPVGGGFRGNLMIIAVVFSSVDCPEFDRSNRHFLIRSPSEKIVWSEAVYTFI
jgi:hypothetical protein